MTPEPLRRLLAKETLYIPTDPDRPGDRPPPVADNGTQEALYALILEAARDSRSTLKSLYVNTARLARPDERELTGSSGRFANPPFWTDQDWTTEKDAELAARLEEWQKGLDNSGNPRWINLTLPDRNKESNSPLVKGVLPPEDESAASPGALEPEKKKNEGGRTDSLTLALFKRILGLLRSRKKKDAEKDTHDQAAERERQGKGSIQTQRAGPLRGFARMLILALIFCILYYALIQKGLLRPLFY